MLFSKREGYLNVRDVLQVDFLDQSTKNRLWSVVDLTVLDNLAVFRDYNYTQRSTLKSFIISFWQNIIEEPTDTIPRSITD